MDCEATAVQVTWQQWKGQCSKPTTQHENKLQPWMCNSAPKCDRVNMCHYCTCNYTGSLVVHYILPYS